MTPMMNRIFAMQLTKIFTNQAIRQIKKTASGAVYDQMQLMLHFYKFLGKHFPARLYPDDVHSGLQVGY